MQSKVVKGDPNKDLTSAEYVIVVNQELLEKAIKDVDSLITKTKDNKFKQAVEKNPELEEFVNILQEYSDFLNTKLEEISVKLVDVSELQNLRQGDKIIDSEGTERTVKSVDDDILVFATRQEGYEPNFIANVPTVTIQSLEVRDNLGNYKPLTGYEMANRLNSLSIDDRITFRNGKIIILHMMEKIYISSQ